MNIALATCYYLVGPLFPLFLDSIYLTESQIGLILGIGSMSGAFSTLISGYLADRFSAKTLFYSSILVNGLSVLVIAYTGRWGIIILVWMVFNLSQSLFETVRLSYIGEKAMVDNRGKLYGFMNLAWPIAGIIGPTLSGRLAETLGWTQVFLVAAMFCLLGLIPIQSIQTSKKTKTTVKIGFDRQYISVLALHFSFHVLLTSAIGIMNMSIPIYLSEHFKLNYSIIGLVFTISNIAMMIIQLPSGALADKYGMKKTSIVVLSLVPFTYFAWVFIDNWVILLIARALSMGLWSMTWGATTVLVTEAVSESMRGTAIGVRMTGYRVGYTLGPIISGYLISHFGGVTPFVAATILFSSAIPLGLRFKEVKKNH